MVLEAKVFQGEGTHYKGVTSRLEGLNQSHDATISRLLNSVNPSKRTLFLVEGPPIYAYPMNGYRSQLWTSPEFVLGWTHLDRLVQCLEIFKPSVQTSHWLMVDDVNNKPNLEGKSHTIKIEQVLEDISKAVGRRIPLFSRVNRSFLESEFIEDSNNAQCATLDASFQMQKIVDTLEMDSDVEAVLVICHPEAFKNQQRMMLEHLLNEMRRSDRLSQVSKQSRRDLVSKLFRHIWVDNQGEISELTIPIWGGNSFEFRNPG